MIRATFDPSVWSFMSVEVPATAPGGFALALCPKLPQLAPLHAEGWQVHEHVWLGNGYVRATTAVVHYMNGALTEEYWAAYQRAAGQRDAAADPRGAYISRKAEEDVAMAAHMTAHQARLRPAKDPIAYREEWFKGPRPAGTPIDDSAARRAWGTI